ncbi:hypothetical protein [Anaerosporobacter sp.]
MKKNIKLIIAVILIASMITACSKSNNKENVTDSVANTNNTVAENTEPTDNEDSNTNVQQEETQEDDTDKTIPVGVQQLFQVKFTAKKQATSQDITEYYSSAKMVNASKVTKTKVITEDLTELLIEKVNLADGESIIDAMLTKKEISSEEFTKHTKTEVVAMGSVTAIQIDGDNDGIDDIVALNFGGGSGGFCNLEFYKGAEDQTYTLTNSYSCLLTSFGVLSYEGKNYLVLKDYDYNTKNYNGYSLLLYDDGKLADGKSISLEVEDYDMNIVQEEDSFTGIEEVKKTLSKKTYPSILEKSDYVIYGNAEKKSQDNKYEYSADIDNNGVDENYNKNMFLPSSIGTIMFLEYEFETTNNLEEIDELLTKENAPLYAFWIDKVADKNVLYVYFGENQDYTLYAYLIQK